MKDLDNTQIWKDARSMQILKVVMHLICRNALFNVRCSIYITKKSYQLQCKDFELHVKKTTMQLGKKLQGYYIRMNKR